MAKTARWARARVEGACWGARVQGARDQGARDQGARVQGRIVLASCLEKGFAARLAAIRIGIARKLDSAVASTWLGEFDEEHRGSGVFGARVARVLPRPVSRAGSLANTGGLQAFSGGHRRVGPISWIGCSGRGCFGRDPGQRSGAWTRGVGSLFDWRVSGAGGGLAAEAELSWPAAERCSA